MTLRLASAPLKGTIGQISYAFSDRFSATLTLPYATHERSSSEERVFCHGGSFTV